MKLVEPEDFGLKIHHDKGIFTLSLQISERALRDMDEDFIARRIASSFADLLGRAIHLMSEAINGNEAR